MSIIKVDKNKYRIFISDGFNVDGSRRRFSKTITTDLKGRDLKRFLSMEELEFETSIKDKDPRFLNLSKGTFESYSSWWLNYKIVSVKTKDTYAMLLNTWVLPILKDKILEKISTGDLIETMNIISTTKSKQTKKVLSDKSIKHIHTLVKIMFNDAIYLQILEDNPITRVPVKSPSTKLKDNYYNKEDLNNLFKVLPASPIKYQLAILLAISTGMRLGELAGLQWKHIDVNECYVLVEQSASYTANTGVFIKSTKTENIRTITFPDYLTDLIEAHRKESIIRKKYLGDNWYYKNNNHKEDFVFTQENGKVVFPRTISQYFEKLIKKHDLKKITFHGLRHTNTTMLISSGINVRSISNRLGHSRTSTTTDFYAHALESVERESATVFQDIFDNGTKSGTKKEEIDNIR